MITMIVGDYNDGLNHQYKAMFKERRTHQGEARHLIVHRLPYSITRNKGLNSPRLIPGFTEPQVLVISE